MGIEEFPLSKSEDVADLKKKAEQMAAAHRRLKLKRIAAQLAVELHSHDTIIDDLAVINSANVLFAWLCLDEPVFQPEE